jgi:hypothetical protein
MHRPAVTTTDSSAAVIVVSSASSSPSRCDFDLQCSDHTGTVADCGAPIDIETNDDDDERLIEVDVRAAEVPLKPRPVATTAENWTKIDRTVATGVQTKLGRQSPSREESQPHQCDVDVVGSDGIDRCADLLQDKRESKTAKYHSLPYATGCSSSSGGDSSSSSSSDDESSDGAVNVAARNSLTLRNILLKSKLHCKHRGLNECNSTPFSRTSPTDQYVAVRGGFKPADWRSDRAIAPTTALHHFDPAASVRYTCHLCPLSYKRIADLNRHMKQKHGAHLQEAVRWQAMIMHQCYSWMRATSASVEPLDLTVRHSVVDGDVSTTASRETSTAQQLEPLDLTIRKKGDVGFGSCGQLLKPATIDSGVIHLGASLSSNNVNANNGKSPSSFTRSSAIDGMWPPRDLLNARSVFEKAPMNADFVGEAMNERGRETESSTVVTGEGVGVDAEAHCHQPSSTANIDTSGRGSAEQETEVTCVSGDRVPALGQCPVCSFVSMSPTTMNRHLDIHEDRGRQFHCLICNHCATSLEQLQNHVRRGHLLESRCAAESTTVSDHRTGLSSLDAEISTLKPVDGGCGVDELSDGDGRMRCDVTGSENPAECKTDDSTLSVNGYLRNTREDSPSKYGDGQPRVPLSELQISADVDAGAGHETCHDGGALNLTTRDSVLGVSFDRYSNGVGKQAMRQVGGGDGDTGELYRVSDVQLRQLHRENVDDSPFVDRLKAKKSDAGDDSRLQDKLTCIADVNNNWSTDNDRLVMDDQYSQAAAAGIARSEDGSGRKDDCQPVKENNGCKTLGNDSLSCETEAAATTSCTESKQVYSKHETGMFKFTNPSLAWTVSSRVGY